MDDWLRTKNLPVRLVSAGGLVWRDGKILLRRTPRRGWEFPGGVIEQDEAVHQGLQREIREETGVTAEVMSLAGIYQNLTVKEGYGPLAGVTIPPRMMVDFVCHWAGGDASLREDSLEIGWFAPEEAREMVTWPGYDKRLSGMLTSAGNAYAELPERTVDGEISLIPYYPYVGALEWYLDRETCRQVDSIDGVYTPARLESMYTVCSRKGRCYYIRYRGALVGDVTLFDRGEVAIVVSKPYQNRHIGRRCVEYICRMAMETGMTRLTATIYTFNAQSRAMFEAAGFTRAADEEYIRNL